MTTLGAAGRSVTLAGAASKGLHATPAAAGSHTFRAGVSRSASGGPQFEFQKADLAARSQQIALGLVGPALELHDGFALAYQTARSLPLLPWPTFELQYQFLVESSSLRRLHVVLSKTLWSTFDLQYATLAALRRVLRPEQRLHRQSQVLQTRMVRLRG